MPIGTKLLDAIEEAIATTPWYIPNAPVLQLTGRREILGEYGTRWHGKPLDGEEWATAEPVTHPDQTFSFTRHQCKKMLKTLRRESKRAVRR